MEEQTKKAEDSTEITELLASSYGKARTGLFEDAERYLEKAIAIDFEHTEVVAALKCVNFWKEREKILRTVSEPFEKGEFLLKEWRSFQVFLRRKEEDFEQCVYTIRQFVFGQALFNYMRLYDEESGQDTEILFRLGKCYKGLGNYGKALEFFERASHQKVDDPDILSELADCYAFVNELRAAKVFFREAFFINPQKIDLIALESLLIRRLIERVSRLGFSSPQLEEWVPVYGVLYGVFNVKRELKPLEYGKLKQEIYQLESERKEKPQDTIIIPKLINKYFWLIDHYISNKDPRENVDEVLRKIKSLNESVFELYTN